jgi:hypothetical protein
MNTKEAGARAQRHGTPRIDWTEIARRMKHGVSDLQSNFEGRMKTDPYTALGVAAVAGIGLGIVLGSRILRTAVASAVSYGIVELTRSLIEERIPMTNGFHVSHASEAARSSHS